LLATTLLLATAATLLLATTLLLSAAATLLLAATLLRGILPASLPITCEKCGDTDHRCHQHQTSLHLGLPPLLRD
jgi:hypothetical protein